MNPSALLECLHLETLDDRVSLVTLGDNDKQTNFFCGMTERSDLTDRTLLLSVRSPDGGHVSPTFNGERLISTVDMLTRR